MYLSSSLQVFFCLAKAFTDYSSPNCYCEGAFVMASGCSAKSVSLTPLRDVDDGTLKS